MLTWIWCNRSGRYDGASSPGVSEVLAMSDENNALFSILIVDDIPKNIQVLGSILRQEGYSVSFATSGQQALAAVLGDRFDLILLDVMMPEMDGFEVCRKLKAGAATHGIPVIFLTAKTDQEDIVKGFDAGGVDYVSKPFNPSELLARVRTHLRLKRADDNIRRWNRELLEKGEELQRLNDQLQTALREIKTLEGFLPICASCKKIRKAGAPPDKQESWLSMEAYIMTHTDAKLTHTVCPQCCLKLYPDFYKPK
jgi:DNA-binding response OmpR family regulator